MTRALKFGRKGPQSGKARSMVMFLWVASFCKKAMA